MLARIISAPWSAVTVIAFAFLAHADTRAEGQANIDNDIIVEFSALESPSNRIRLLVTGHVYKEQWLGLPGPLKAGLPPFVGAAVQAMTAYASGELDTMLSPWLPSERNRQHELFAKAEIREKMQVFYSSISRIRPIAHWRYGNYVIVFTDADSTARGRVVEAYPLIHHESRWYLTNSLQDDPVFAHLVAAYKSHLGRGRQ